MVHKSYLAQPGNSCQIFVNYTHYFALQTKD